MRAFVDSIVTFSSQPMQPSGAPAARAASYITRQLSPMHLTARGCGDTTIEHRALSAIRHLKSAVEVGFVVGITAATRPAGCAISITWFLSSRRSTPAVYMSLILSQVNSV